MTTFAKFLGDDHDRCDELFLAAERAVAARDWSNATQHFAAFRAATERHLAMEEQVLFAEFEAGGGTQGPTHVMRMEHDQMRSLFVALTEAVAAHDAQRFLGLAETLLVLMQQHNMKEEHILYPLCDRTMVRERDELIARMQQVSAGAAAVAS